MLRVVRFDGIAPAGAAGACSAVLAVFDAPTASALWEETQIVQVDATGLQRAARRRPCRRPAAGRPRQQRASLARVRFEGGVTSARALLTSVPYALRASDADTLAAPPASAFPGAAAPGREGAASAGASSATVSATTPLVNTGTTGFIGKFANTIDLTSSAMFDSVAGSVPARPRPRHRARAVQRQHRHGHRLRCRTRLARVASSACCSTTRTATSGSSGFNNSTHEYCINNIASGGTINFMLGGSRFFVVSHRHQHVAATRRQPTGSCGRARPGVLAQHEPARRHDGASTTRC
ncbi:MAG: hypothetical protein U0P30_11075 [Vicinamibacterales bacterium]